MMSPTQGEGDLPKGDITLATSPFSKMGGKGEGGVKNLKKMGDVIYGQSLGKLIFGY